MKRQVLLGAVFSAVLAVGVGAQTPATPTQQDPSRPAQQDPTREPAQSSRPESITVTGCLEAGAAASTAAPGTAGTSGTEPGAPSAGAAAGGRDEFKLTNASMGGASSASPTDPQPTGTSGASASSYRLQGQKDELQKYVNSRVEIRGRLDSSRTPGTAGTSRPEASASGMESPRLHVESVRQISASCSGESK